MQKRKICKLSLKIVHKALALLFFHKKTRGRAFSRESYSLSLSSPKNHNLYISRRILMYVIFEDAI